MFRRSSSDGATDGKAQGSQGAQTPEAPAKSKPVAEAGKGRPTPKRSAAESNRYRTLTGSTTSGRGKPAPAAPGRKLTPEEKTRARDDRSKHPTEEPVALERNFLHAAHLSFTHPQTGKPMDLNAPLPPDLTSFLEMLRAEPRVSHP